MKDEMTGFFEAVDKFRDCHAFSIVPEIGKGAFSVLKSIEICEQKYQKSAGVSMMAQTLNQAPPMVSRSLKSLEKRGLIRREVDTSDRRNTKVMLTEAGKEMIHQVDGTLMRFAEEVFEEYGQQELNDLVEKINRLHEVMQRVMKKKKDALECRQKGETHK